MPPALAGNHPVNRPTSSSSTPYGQFPAASRRPSICHPQTRSQPAAEPGRREGAGIAELPPLPDISYDEFDPDVEYDDSLDSGGAEGKATISLNQTEFSLKQFAKRMRQPNFSAFNKWKKVWVAGFLEKKYLSIIPGQNHLKQLHDGPLRWEMVVGEFFGDFRDLAAFGKLP